MFIVTGFCVPRLCFIHMQMSQFCDAMSSIKTHTMLITKINKTQGNINLLLLLGCPSLGYYGENCSIPCPVNCRDGLCDKENGTCYSCLDGYSGPTCNEGYWFIH